MLILIVAIIVIIIAFNVIKENNYKKLEAEVLNKLGYSSLDIIPYYDEHIIVKSRQALENHIY